MTTYTFNINKQFNSIELTFNGKPTAEERNGLKSLHFRWNPTKAIWYGFATLEQIETALQGGKANGTQKKAPTEKVNKFGVKVGDLFVASWGYEQTNLNYFQIVEIVGAEFVRVCEVKPTIKEITAISGMSQNVTISNPNGTLLPKVNRSFCIKDNEKGDRKKVKNFGNENNRSLWIDIDSCISAHFQEGDATYYESWYY